MSDEHNHDEDISIEVEDDIVEESGQQDKLKKMRNELKEAKQEAKDNLDGWQRARADYVNLQKQIDSERSQIRKRAVESILSDLLAPMDNFSMAMANKEVWESVDEKWRVGIEYIYSQFQKVLEDNGVTEVQAKDIFDPELHDPLEIVETDNEKEDGKIIQVMQKGYQLDGKVIRPAKVKFYKYK